MTPKFKCANCGTEHESTGDCDHCSGIVAEYMMMDSPVYQVDVPGIGTVWFPEGAYEAAFENATGRAVTEVGDDHTEESRITTAVFDGRAEVPVASI